MASNKIANRRINIYVNDKDAGKSIRSMKQEMAALNRVISNDLTPGTKEYYEGVKRLQELKGTIKNHTDEIKGVNNEWEKSTKKADDSTKGLLKLGKAFGALAVVNVAKDYIVEFTSEMFRMGSEMEVLEKKAQTVFGEALPQVTAKAMENADSLGLTTGQYIDQAAAIGDLLIPMKFTREEAGEISTTLVDLSGALSEWTGGTKSAIEVNEILGKAILGEREGLKQLGISINEADVKTRLAEKGLAGLTGEMLQQAKAATTLELVMEKSTDAQDAFQKNADTLIRKQAVMNARFQEIKETLAKALIPVFARLMDVLMPVSDVVKQTSDFLSAGVEPTGKYSDAVRFLSAVLIGLYNYVKDQIGVWTVLYNDAFLPIFNFMQKFFQPTFDILGRIINRNGNETNKLAGSFQLMTTATKMAVAPIKVVVKLFEFMEEVIQKSIVKLFEFNNGLIDVLNGIADFAGYELNLPKYNIQATKNYFSSMGKQAGDSFNDGIEESSKQTGINPSAPNLPNLPNGTLPPVNTGSGKTDDAAEKAAEERLKNIQKLNEEIQKIRHDDYLNSLSEKQKKVQLVRDEFEEKIALASELMGAESEEVAALTSMQNERIQNIENDFLLQREEQRNERHQKKIEKMQEELEEETEILSELKTENFNAELERLDEQYTALLNQAEQYGIDVTDIQESYEAERLRIKEEYNARQLENEKKQIETEFLLQQTKVKNFQKGVGILQKVFKDNAGMQKALLIFEKGLAAAELVIEFQKQKALIQTKYAAIPGGQAFAAAEITAAGVNLGLGLATIAATAIPSFAQKKKGGFHQARGEDDRRTYNAEYIGRPMSGLLPPGPKLVLANEAGPEYFVSNDALRIPAVADHVRIIENIVRPNGRYTQFVEGGFTATPTTDNTTNNNDSVLIRSMQINDRLASILEKGIHVVIGEDEAAELVSLQEIIRKKAGG